MKNLLLPYWLLVASRRALIGLPCLFICLSSRGISDTEIGIALAALALAQVGFEVPSGVVSDKLGRRMALILGGLLRSFGWFFLATAHSPEGVIAGFTCLGASFAFDSGADSAWLYDSLKDIEQGDRYAALEAKGHTIGLVAMGVATLMGGWLMLLSMDLALYCTIVPMVVSASAAAMLKEPKATTQSSDTKFWTEVRIGIGAVLREKFVLQVVVLAAFGVAALEVYFRFVQQLVTGQLALPVQAMGYVYALWLLISAYGSRIVPKLLAMTRVVVIARWAVVLLGLTLVWLGGTHSSGGILLTIVPQLCIGILPVLMRTEVNRTIESSARTTILSTFGFLTSILIFLLAPVVGFLSDLLGYGSTIVCLGVILLASTVLAHILFEAKRWRARPNFTASLWG